VNMLEHLFDYGFAGAAIVVLSFLAWSWQRAYIQNSKETNAVLRALTEVIGKCRGPASSHRG
jgi:hypothetical protein